MEQQLTQLGWYQEELAKLHGEAGKKAALDQQATPKKDKAARAEAEADTAKKNKANLRKKGKRSRILRATLAAQFKENLAEAGCVEKRLAALVPEVKKQGSKKDKKKTKKKKTLTGKLKKKTTGRVLTLKLKHSLKRKRKAAAQKLAALEAEGTLEAQLGQSGGAWETQRVRLTAFGLSPLLRNSPAVVNSHYDTGLLTVTLTSGSQRTFPQRDLYLLTGTEKLMMPEVLADMKKVTAVQKQTALTAAGGQLRSKIESRTQLESPEMMAAFHEIGCRAAEAGDVWPNPAVVCLNITEMEMALYEWNLSPGSPESQQLLLRFRGLLQPVLANPRMAALIHFPVHAGGHWTLLTFRRTATPEEQSEANKLTVCYRDSLSPPLQSCLAKARLAMGFLLEVCGQSQLAQHCLPAVSPCATQTDTHSCGFFCLSIMEEDYR